MSDPIITRHLSPYVSEQGPASELNRDRAQVAALGASNVQKLHNAPSGDLISREAAVAALDDHIEWDGINPALLEAALRSLPAISEAGEVERLRLEKQHALDTADAAVEEVARLKAERDAALDLVAAVEILTATAYGLTPEETSALHWMAAAGRAEEPITEASLGADLVKAQEVIVRLQGELATARADALEEAVQEFLRDGFDDDGSEVKLLRALKEVKA